MRTTEEIQRYIEHLPPAEREQIVTWIVETGGMDYGVAQPAAAYGAVLKHCHLGAGRQTRVDEALKAFITTLKQSYQV